MSSRYIPPWMAVFMFNNHRHLFRTFISPNTPPCVNDDWQNPCWGNENDRRNWIIILNAKWLNTKQLLSRYILYSSCNGSSYPGSMVLFHWQLCIVPEYASPNSMQWCQHAHIWFTNFFSQSMQSQMAVLTCNYCASFCNTLCCSWTGSSTFKCVHSQPCVTRI